MEQANTAGIERKALIFNVQKYNMYDGPGIRTIVFFKGCPLRCRWCSNPEGMERKIQVILPLLYGLRRLCGCLPGGNPCTVKRDRETYDTSGH